MNMQELDQAVQRFFAAGLAPATHKTYLSAERRYLDFCNSFSFAPLPTSDSILCYFVAYLGQQGLDHTSIRTYLSGVHQLQIAYGWNDPGIDQMPRLQQILKGIKVECGKKGSLLGHASQLPQPYLESLKPSGWEVTISPLMIGCCGQLP